MTAEPQYPHRTVAVWLVSVPSYQCHFAQPVRLMGTVSLCSTSQAHGDSVTLHGFHDFKKSKKSSCIASPRESWSFEKSKKSSCVTSFGVWLVLEKQGGGAGVDFEVLKSQKSPAV